ncbi:MAG: hypothetical protein K0Q57_736 [Gammaproteobacteria bacterium]|jgi:cytochrome b561|nr:hypothetical protein [Gammaproteobacteria bacterium]
MTQHQWDKPSKILHAIFGLAVITQLITSQLMQNHPALFYVHVAGGVTALTSVIVYLSLKIKQHKLFSFYPYSIVQFINIKNDVMNMLKFRALPDREAGGLPGLVQGLGLLLIVAMALTGATGFVIYHWLPWKQIATVSINIHSVLATFVWIYIIGHTAMACLHWLLQYWNKRSTG